MSNAEVVLRSAYPTRDPDALHAVGATMTEQLFFPASRADGLARLDTFLPASGRTYAAQRNTDYGCPPQGQLLRPNVSVLSPYVRHRLVTEEEVLRAVLSRHSPSAADKFISEVVWRAYFKGHLETRPQIWHRYREHVARSIAEGATEERGYRAAISGQTGIACFDSWVEELVTTGYLHNHTRMWFASIWMFTLKLPWQLGADFTLRHFLDGDPASNTLSWRWVGGLHTKGKTYLARRDNIREHTAGRFDPEGLARVAVPLDEPPIGAAVPLVQVPERPATGSCALLVTEEDLGIENYAIHWPDVRAIWLARESRQRSPLPTGVPVTSFVEAALKDTASRLAERSTVVPRTLPKLTPDIVRREAQAAGITRIITPYAPVGPTAEALALLYHALAPDGITVERFRRRYDSAIWPHATRGFFAVREKIPSLLEQLDLLPRRQGELF